MIFKVIRDHLTPEFVVVDCCRVLGVSASGYHHRCKHPAGKRQKRRGRVVERQESPSRLSPR